MTDAVAARESRLRLGRRDRQGRRRHDRPPLRRRADRQGRPAGRGLRHDRRGRGRPRARPRRAWPQAGARRRAAGARPGSPTSSCASSASCSSSVRSSRPTPTAWDRLQDGTTRVSADDGRGDRRAPAGPRSARRDAARVRRPGRVAHQRGPRAGADHPPPRRAARRGAQARRHWFRDPIWYRI